MKKIHYIYVCLAMLASAVFSAQAASEAEYGKLVKNYTLHPDGSQELRVKKELTLFTHTAMNQLYGESFIIYNPTFQELKINDSYTRQKDGNIVKTPQNAFVEVLPAAAADAPAYNTLKEMVIVHTGLELGATIYLDYSLITRPGCRADIDVCEQVEELSPIKEYQLSISVPESKSLHYAWVNGNVRPQERSENGNKLVTWTLKNVPALPFLNNSLALSGGMQMIVASTCPSVADALALLKGQFKAAEEPEVIALAQKLIEGKQTSEAKEAALSDYVRRLGNSSLTLAQTAYKVRSATEVIRTAYGTQAEKVNLLSGLLKAAGLPSEIKAAYKVKADPDCMGLSAIETLFVQDPTIADRQEYQPVLNLDGKKVNLPVKSHVVNSVDTMNITAQTDKALAGNYQLVTLPHVSEGIASYGYASGNTTCSMNLLLPYKADETYTCVLNLPANMQLCALPETHILENKIGKVTVTVKKESDKMEVIRAISLKKQLITPAEYADFRRLMVEWVDAANTTLLLKMKE